jgi:hypothetical protein
MWPFSKKIDDVLKATKTISVLGVKFVIKKIDPTSYLDGSKVMLEQYAIYKKADAPDIRMSEKTLEKIKNHYQDVFMAGVISPKLSRKDVGAIEGDILPVGNLMTDWEFANDLYVKIIEFTYGKKKMKLST